MKFNFINWYVSTSLHWRRIVLATLVPVLEYFFLEPVRKNLIAVGSRSSLLGIAFMFLILLFGILTATVVCLFAYEFIIGMGNKIKSKIGSVVFAFAVLGWILMPLHLISKIGAK